MMNPKPARDPCWAALAEDDEPEELESPNATPGLPEPWIEPVA